MEIRDHLIVSSLRSLWPIFLVLSVLLLLPIGRLAELPVIAAALIALWFAFRNRLGSLDQYMLVMILFACYWVPALLSAFTAVNPNKTWSTALSILRFLPFAIFVLYALRHTSAWPSLLLASALLVLLWVLDAWVQIGTGYSLGGAAEPERLSGIFGADNLKLGQVLATLSPFLLHVLRTRFGRIGLTVGFLLLLFPILLAGSRASWLAYALVCIVFAWRETRNIPRFATLVGIILGLWISGAWLIWHVSSTFHTRMERSLLALQGTAHAVDEASAGRLRIWHTALEMTQAHPLFGVGVRGFRYAYPHYAAADDRFIDSQNATGAAHAHQIVLEIISETGVIGLLFWLSGAWFAIRAWRRADVQARERAFAPGVALVAMCFPLNTHLAFYSAWWGLLFWWLIALYCAALAAQEDAYA